MTFNPGDPLHKITAPFLNRVGEAADHYHARKALGEGGREPGGIVPTDRVKVKNSSGGAVRRGEVLEFTSFLLSTDLQNEYPWFDGETPDLTNVGWGISRAPVPNTAIEEFQIAGRAIAYVNFSDADHRYAAPASGLKVLASACYGPVKILYKPSGTGEKECWVQFVDDCDHPALIVDFTITAVNCETDDSANATVSNSYHGRYPGATITVYGEDDCVCRAPVGTRGIALWDACQDHYVILFLRQWVDVVTGICTEESGSPPTETTLQVVTPVQVLCVGEDYGVTVTDCTGGDDVLCDPCPALKAGGITIEIRGAVSESLTAEMSEQNELFIEWRTATFEIDGTSGYYVAVQYKCGDNEWNLRTTRDGFGVTDPTIPLFLVPRDFEIVDPSCDSLCITASFESAGGEFTVYAGEGCEDIPDDDPFTPPECSGGEIQQTIYDTAGDHTWTAPANGKVLIECIGSGGGGAGSYNPAGGMAGAAAGGGAGARAYYWDALFSNGYTVTAALALSVRVGSPGTGGAAVAESNAGEGNPSWVKNGMSTIVYADFGNGAIGAATGAGGAAASCTGTHKYSGGAGGNSSPMGGGGGGGGIGTGTSDGSAGGSGSAFGGGTGGNYFGGAGGGPGQAGNDPITSAVGGGGGGAGAAPELSGFVGGNGAVGQVIIYFCAD